MTSELIELTVSDFVAVINQTLDYAYSSVVICGELANFRISKNRWVYFDLKDEDSKVSFFGSVYVLPGPIEEGMLIKVRGTPRLHPQYGFSVVVSSMSPAGDGSIKRLNDLLTAKLEKEGLFAVERKRQLAYPPSKIGLVTSMQSAAFADFIKIINARWGGIDIDCYDVVVQGNQAPNQLIEAIAYFSALANPPEILVIIRGGGSPEDLAAFSHEQVVRAVAASRVPTLIAIGHESDISLAELVADRRASTPSNAAELIVPDKQTIIDQLSKLTDQFQSLVMFKITLARSELTDAMQAIPLLVSNKINYQINKLDSYSGLLNALSPKNILRRGYAIVRIENEISNGEAIRSEQLVDIEMYKTSFAAIIKHVKR